MSGYQITGKMMAISRDQTGIKLAVDHRDIVTAIKTTETTRISIIRATSHIHSLEPTDNLNMDIRTVTTIKGMASTGNHIGVVHINHRFVEDTDTQTTSENLLHNKSMQVKASLQFKHLDLTLHPYSSRSQRKDSVYRRMRVRLSI